MRKDNYYMQDRLPKEQKNYFLCIVSYFGTSANMKKIELLSLCLKLSTYKMGTAKLLVKFSEENI